MVFEMHASNGGPVLPQEVGGPSTGAPSVEPTLPATSQIKEYPPFSESRNQSRHRRQGRHWYKRPNGKGKQAQHAPQPEEDHRQNQYQDQGQPLPQPRPQHQHRPPVKVVVDRPDYFNFNPSNGLHTPGLFHPGAYGYGPQPVGYFAPPPPLLMPMPLLSPQFDPFSTSLAALPAEHHKQRLWDEMEVCTNQAPIITAYRQGPFANPYELF